MTRKSYLIRTHLAAALLTPLLAGSLLGCSFFKNLSTDQCTNDGECKQFGADYTCSSEKVCVEHMANTGGSQGMSGSGGDGGTGGAVVPECAANADCIDAHSGAPYICQNGACVSLTIPVHCPSVIAGPSDAEPTKYLTQPGKPIIFGAYVPIDVAAPLSNPYTLNYQFALEQFMTGTLGGVGSPKRPFVMVLCQSNQPDLKSSIDHLVNTLNVPAILATLPSTDLASAFDLVTATKHKVFLLGPFEADSALANEPDKGLMWHMLGPTTDLIPAYAPLMQLAETYITTKVNPSHSGPIKVAVVNSDLSFSQDMAAALPSAVQVNGSTLDSAANRSNYQSFQVTVTGKATPDVSAVVQKLGDDGSADIVVSLGGPEFINQIVPQIQAKRTTLGTSPFYILSPSNAFDQNLTSAAYFSKVTDPTKPPSAGMSLANKIMAGVNYASVVDDTLYQSYLKAIKARFPNTPGLDSRENLYDAAYFMLYSLSAAAHGSDDFDGAAVADGMKHLVVLGGSPATVGPATNVNTVLAVLMGGGDVELTGTLGPPDFNLTTGARRNQGSVWCVQQNPLPAPPTVEYDALRLDSTMKMLTQKSGDTFCFPGFGFQPTN